MRRVKILLSCGVNSQNYVDAVSELGADATASYLPTVDTSYDGLILCGGNDINPKHYAETAKVVVGYMKNPDSLDTLCSAPAYAIGVDAPSFASLPNSALCKYIDEKLCGERVDTIFDALIRGGKKPVIVSTAGDSLSKIFLERKMDYYIYDSIEKVNAKAAELIIADKYDFMLCITEIMTRICTNSVLKARRHWRSFGQT